MLEFFVDCHDFAMQNLAMTRPTPKPPPQGRGLFMRANSTSQGRGLSNSAPKLVILSDSEKSQALKRYLAHAQYDKIQANFHKKPKKQLTL